MRRKIVWKWLGLVVLVSVTISAGWHFQQAQAQGFSGNPGPYPCFCGRNSGDGTFNRIDSAAIAVNKGYIYAMQGNTLYKFTEKDLSLVKRVELSPLPPTPTPPNFGNGNGEQQGGFGANAR